MAVTASEENQQKVMQAFATWDASGDGFISKAELKRMMKCVGLKEENCNTLFAAMDTNHDNQISYSEFLDYIFKGKEYSEKFNPIRASKSPKEAAELILQHLQEKLDEVGDKKSVKQQERALFDSFDMNHNGKISASEWIAGLRNLRIGGTKPITTLEFPDQLLTEVFHMIEQAKEISYGFSCFADFGSTVKVDKHGMETVMEKSYAFNLKDFRAFLHREHALEKQVGEHSSQAALYQLHPESMRLAALAYDPADWTQREAERKMTTLGMDG